MPGGGIYLRLTHIGPQPRSSLFLNDVEYGEGGRPHAGHGGYPRHGVVYVPASGSVDVIFTSTVALSYETGTIAGFINRGLLSATFVVGPAFAGAVSQYQGWANYADLATTGVPAALPAGVWTALPCDGLGPGTTDAFKPVGVTKFYDVPTQRLYLRDTAVGNYLAVRVGVTVTPTVNNSRLQMRLLFLGAGVPSLERELPRLGSGAGTPYPFMELFEFPIESNAMRLGDAVPQLLCGSNATMTVDNFLVHLG
ncbi:MAG: hypothetical protein A2Y38_12255 [Spirochaetes bacterium GWB1_59_5]|nr:MAG: hypothetical protein A2Y38_12255 [Spirochaetes bacterium GWB1_59_5]